MLDYRTSALFQKLVREGVAKPPAGTDGIGNEMVGRSQIGAAPQLPLQSRGSTAGGERSGVWLAWVNPTAMRQSANMLAPFLMVVPK